MSKVFFGLYDNWKQAALWGAVGIPTTILALYLFDNIGGGITNDRIELQSEYEYQSKSGNPAVERSTESPAVFRNKIANSVGEKIVIPKFFVWYITDYSPDPLGGNNTFVISNDSSMGSQFRIACYLSPDSVNTAKERREVDLTGTIYSYTTTFGLEINPCEITRDELKQ